MNRQAGYLGLAASSVLLSSSLCSSCAAAEPRRLDPATWREVDQALERERQSSPDRPWAAGVLVTMHEPRLGHTIDGRGAIAVLPRSALRMILVGAAGTTMLDAWVTPERWRVAIPPVGVLRRGGGGSSVSKREADDPADLPVGFLRWSFFRPLAGTLFGGSVQPGRVQFLLRDGDAVIDVRLGACPRGERRVTTRRVQGRSERLEECRESAAVTPGDWVRYEDEKSGLAVDLTIESAAAGPPDQDAFRDPDADGG